MFNFNIFSKSDKINLDSSFLTMSYKIPLIEDLNDSNTIVELEANTNNKIKDTIYKAVYKKNNKIKYNHYNSIKKYIKPKYKKYNYTEYSFYNIKKNDL